MSADDTTAAVEPQPFWRVKTLEQMTALEWESLCDGCGKCCLLKFIDQDSGEVDYTDVACRLLDLGTGRCGDYPNRHSRVKGCIRLTPATVRRSDWLPTSCAYRLIAEGSDLAWWHPLVSGDRETVHRAGVSIRGRAVPERRAGNPEHRIVTWPR